MSISIAQMLAYEQRKKSLAAALVLWFFLWWLGAHRFYLRSPYMAVLVAVAGCVASLMAALSLGLLAPVCLVLWLAELIWLVQRVEAVNKTVLFEVVTEGMRDDGYPPLPAPRRGWWLSASSR